MATKRPWRQAGHNPMVICAEGIADLAFCGGDKIDLARHGERAANSELIVRAVNSFDDLVGICAEYIAYREGNDGNIDDIAARMKTILKRCRGESCKS